MVSTPQSLGVVFGGPSPEHDVSVLTGLQAVHALAAPPATTEVHALYWSRTGEFFEVPADSEAVAFTEAGPPDARPLELVLGPGGGFRPERTRLGARRAVLELGAVVVCCHGGAGEDGTLQGALDLAGVPYSGPSAAGAALGMDKLASAGVLAAAGLPVLERVQLSSSCAPGFAGPYIVKPRFGGSSIGIEVVADLDAALALGRSSVHLRRGAVLEPYRPDLYDLEIALRTYPEPMLSAIARPRRAHGGEILGFADKYVAGEGMSAAPRELPAAMPADLAEQLRALARRTGDLLGVRGVGRVDFLCDGGALYVNEVNTVPGSLARYLFVDPPVAFASLLSDLAAEAIERPAASLSSAGADGRVLRDAQHIAAKLA